MFCSNCGQKAGDQARFCVRCGHSLIPGEPPALNAAGPVSGFQPVCLAFYLKAGVLKKEPSALWIGPDRWAIIDIGQSRYQNLLADKQDPVFSSPLAGVREQLFCQYATNMTNIPLEQVVATHPGSVLIDWPQIIAMQCIATYDSDMRRYDDYERFILETSMTTYRGSFERNTDLRPVKALLTAMLGSRYQYRTIEGFPFI